jgi:hypothetical protein
MNCVVCDKPLARGTKSGRCRLHPSSESAAKRSAALILKYASDPSYRAVQRATGGCRSEKGRQALSARAKREKLWERGQAAFTPETFKKRGDTIRAKRLAHIPVEYRGLYMELRRKYRVPVVDALAAVEQQQAADVARFRREVAG